MAKKTTKKAVKRAALRKSAPPKLTECQLTMLRHVGGAPGQAPTAFDRRTLNSLRRQGLVAVSAKAVQLTKSGAAFLGG